MTHIVQGIWCKRKGISHRNKTESKLLPYHIPPHILCWLSMLRDTSCNKCCGEYHLRTLGSQETTWCCHPDQGISLTRPCCKTTEVSDSFFTSNGARLIILIHPSETIWVYRTGSSSQSINISPSVPTEGEELEKTQGSSCCCGGSSENTEICQLDWDKMCYEQKSTCLFFTQSAWKWEAETPQHCRGNLETAGLYVPYNSRDKTMQFTLHCSWSDQYPNLPPTQRQVSLKISADVCLQENKCASMCTREIFC